ncbi:hypothetical protein RGP44_002900 [Serratia marcescens]|uniref:hypothetical protein n=1 Tax=Serratia marcescens TaxID=615 RepID=UPI000446E193|nr:hypothetical protein [Serratia marcescens]ELN4405959.1 hypothetical protein [Serratia marcescens]ETX38538.1 hypothetical protein P805_04398 [Serratia marcescens BIDMC 44]HBC0576082.1 hypothetical protein [Serratia marcescens]HBV3812583.1 hypothetical protein [Serratia marcescens]
MNTLTKIHYQQAFLLNGDISKDYDGISYFFKKECRKYGVDINVDQSFSGMPDNAPKEIPRLQMISKDGHARLVVSPIRADFTIDFLGMKKDFNNEMVKDLSVTLFNLMGEVGITVTNVGNVIQHAYSVGETVGFIKKTLLNNNNKLFLGVNDYVGIRYLEAGSLLSDVSLSVITEVESAIISHDLEHVVMIKRDVNNFNGGKFDINNGFLAYIDYVLMKNEDEEIYSIFGDEV